jgi:hypothetical protein
MKFHCFKNSARQARLLRGLVLVCVGVVGFLATQALPVRAEESAVHQLPPVESLLAQPATFFDEILTEDENGASQTAWEERLTTL